MAWVASVCLVAVVAACLLCLWLVLRPHLLGWCHDCGARPGELHSLGCDMEECPYCGRQLIGCDCFHRAHGIPVPGESSEEQSLWSVAHGPEYREHQRAFLDRKGRITYGSETRFRRAGGDA